MRVLIDDMRDYLPGQTVADYQAGIGGPDIILRTFEVGKKFVAMREDIFDWKKVDLYLDHDLGFGGTGYDLICIFEQAKFEFEDKNIPRKIVCVSDNPVGRQRIELVIKKMYGRLWSE